MSMTDKKQMKDEPLAKDAETASVIEDHHPEEKSEQTNSDMVEHGGPKGLEPTRFGD
ncbi:MAG: DUF1674 domain-containing protein, partial [Candidatus Puniceispirillales bacterium]